jgi:DNA-binding MarR family transcriptional regulator
VLEGRVVKTQRNDRPGYGSVLRRAHRRFARVLGIMLADYDLTIGQFQILRALFIQDAMTQRELSDVVEVEKGALTKLFISLEKQGYVTRRRHVSDARKSIVRLTQRGRMLRAPLQGVAKSIDATASGKIPKTDLETTERTLHALIANIESIDTKSLKLRSNNPRKG